MYLVKGVTNMTRSILWASLLIGLLEFGLPAILTAQTTTEVHPGRGGSPHVKTTWTLSGTDISITYGRPYVKGRTIFGDLVPYDQVWRTGADEATTLEISADIVIGETKIPKGAYTLYTLPGETTWQLIVNKETGQWGTQYSSEEDLVRIDMHRETRSTPLEQLSINVTLSDNETGSGTLEIEWNTTRISVPIRVKT